MLGSATNSRAMGGLCTTEERGSKTCEQGRGGAQLEARLEGKLASLQQYGGSVAWSSTRTNRFTIQPPETRDEPSRAEPDTLTGLGTVKTVSVQGVEYVSLSE